ncbi:MAG: helix-turn-helix transcriptional regulator [Acholeplasmatales bacterium]|nr:helix-turn-helix transcriptional regulator [Acholeplasmatales bacterium]
MIRLSENISKYRKEKQMTQEDLASALGVTFAAVSKWERGVATPELSLIVRMAGLFDISTDSLIGYEIEDKNIKTLIDKTDKLIASKKYQEALNEINDALFRYPNNFKIVYLGAKTYYIAGFKLDKKEYFKRCIELFERSILLINQNDDNEINEVSIQGEIAQCYISLGEIDKGIEIFKKYNVNGLYNAAIAYSAMLDGVKNKIDVEPFINNSITTLFSNLTLTIVSSVDYYKKTKKYDKAIDSLLWLKDIFINSKKDNNKSAYYDKIVAYIYAEAALCAYYKKDNKANEYLNLAYEYATKFDKDPVFKLDNIKLYTDTYKDVYAVDSLGESAMESVYKALKDEKVLLQKFEKIRGENNEKKD